MYRSIADPESAVTLNAKFCAERRPPSKHRLTRVLLAMVTMLSAVVVLSASAPVDAGIFSGTNGEEWDESQPIDVCWLTTGYTTQKAWVKDAVEATWQRHSRLNFTNWGSCPNPPALRRGQIQIAIKNADTTDNAFEAQWSSIGQQPHGNRMALNFHSKFDQNKVRAYAIHEFGHALGFRHEHGRTGLPDNVLRENGTSSNNGCSTERGTDRSPSPPHTYVGAKPDIYSVMSYCNDRPRSLGNYLSPVDIATVQRYYGQPSWWPTDVSGADGTGAGVAWSASSGIIASRTGNRFEAAALMTRGEAIQALYEYAQRYDSVGWSGGWVTLCNSQGKNFTDVRPGHPNYRAVYWACAHRVTQGVSNTSFDPGAALRRQDFMTFFHRMAGNPGYRRTETFADVPISGIYYSDPVYWAANKGIVQGVGGGRFGVNENLVRGHAAAMFYRFHLYETFHSNAKVPLPVCNC